MKKIRVGINGFGRIGRAAFKIMLSKDNFEVVGINDLSDSAMLAHLLQYDTVYGKYAYEVTSTESSIVVNGKQFELISEPDPSKLPWGKLKVDVVLECTGRFVKDGAASAHLDAGAKRVIVSAPVKGGGDVPTFLRGVNDGDLKDESLISNASCTTNCIAPVISVLNDRFGVLKALMTTIHSYTADQRLQDAPHRDLRRARAAAQNIVPTTTGAALSTTKVIPDLEGLFDGMAVRVPTIVGSLSDFSLVLAKKVTVEQINEAFKDAAANPIYKGVLTVTEEPIVSSDIIGNSHSSIVDLGLTKVVDGDLVKVVSWYDNEWGYSTSMVEMTARIAS